MTASPGDSSVAGFSSTFTITSAAGTVTGTKRLDGAAIHGQAMCDEEGFLRTLGLTTLYTGNINGARNTGVATVSILGLVGEGPPVFSENFGSTGVVQKQCKHGGWKSFNTMFKNQGDCVSFFATGAKNPPAGQSSAEMRLLPTRPRARRAARRCRHTSIWRDRCKTSQHCCCI